MLRGPAVNSWWLFLGAWKIAAPGRKGRFAPFTSFSGWAYPPDCSRMHGIWLCRLLPSQPASLGSMVAHTCALVGAMNPDPWFSPLPHPGFQTLDQHSQQGLLLNHFRPAHLCHNRDHSQFHHSICMCGGICMCS